VIWLAVAVSAASILVSLAVGRVLPRASRLDLQLAGLAFLSVCIPLSAVLASGWVMFHMGADVKILAVAAGSASAAIVAGVLLARSIAKPLRELSDAAGSIAGGDLSARAPTTGNGEFRALATAFNTMAAAVEQLFDARPHRTVRVSADAAYAGDHADGAGR
jgi:methyl-accepting chemotaxis protein